LDFSWVPISCDMSSDVNKLTSNNDERHDGEAMCDCQ
jgi:hypothetical protein